MRDSKKYIIRMVSILTLAIAISICMTFSVSDNTKVQASSNKASSKSKTLTEDEITERANEILKGMTYKEKLAQMILVTAPYNAATVQKTYQFGGYILMGYDFTNATPASIKQRISNIQKNSKVKMLIAVDEEGGTVVRVSQYRQFRSTAFNSPRVVFARGGWNEIISDTKEKSNLLHNLGINTNLAPDADVAYSSSDFIYKRSFSTNYKGVSKYVRLSVETMAKCNEVSTLKHFPGYGNNGDTHTNLITDHRTKASFKARDLKPFEAGIKAGCDMIMVSHNIVNCFDRTKPASLSPKVISYLRKDMGYKGVIVTDSITMAGTTQFTGSVGKAAVMAVQAGEDMICTSEYNETYKALCNAYKSKTITKKRVNRSVRRILKMKLRRGIIK